MPPEQSADPGFNPFSMLPQPAPGPMMPPMPPPPPPMKMRPETPDKKTQKIIQDYVGTFCRNSSEYVRKKVWLWRLWDALYHDELTLHQWQYWRRHCGMWNTGQSRREINDLLPKTEDTAPADYVHSPAYLVKSFVDNAYQAIFSGPEYLTIIAPPSNHEPSQSPVGPPGMGGPPATQPGAPPPPASNASDFAIDQRVQRLLEDALESASIHARLKVCLAKGAKLGWALAKVSWFQDRIPVELANPFTGKTMSQEWHVVREGPLVEAIPAERVIVDPQARHGDVQRWRGVGHWTLKTYEQCLVGFEGKAPLYNLGKDEFTKRFKGLKGNYSSPEEEVEPDFDRSGSEAYETDGFIRISEVHIAVPLPDKGLTEMVVKIASEASSEDPTGGVMIGLLMGPVIYDPEAKSTYGLRPFAMWQFDATDSPFGRGVIESEESILYLLSQFMSQAQENARRTANPTSLVSPEFKRHLDNEHGGVLPYGQMLPYLDPGIPPDQVAATFPLPEFPQQMVTQQISDLKSVLERSAMSPDVPMAGSQKNQQTATGMGILQQQGQSPLHSHVMDFAQQLLNPLSNICLMLMRQYLKGDQSVVMTDHSGRDVMSQVSLEELKNGQFKVAASITKQDALANVRAQIWRDVLKNVMPVLEPKLLEEGWKPMYSVGVNRLLDLLKFDKSADFLHKLSTYEQQLIQTLQKQQMQIQEMGQQMQILAQQAQQGQIESMKAKSAGNGNGQAPPAANPGDNGGPLGPIPSDENMAMMQLKMAQEPNMGFE